jgi:predicted NUDIX family NTP pyrophosphohydrolase
MYRRGSGGATEVLLVHPGGPFWVNKDAGAWSIPKGEVTADEDLLDAAKREFGEELGFEARGEFRPLGMIKQKAGKLVHAWAFEGDCDPSKCTSNTYNVEWPPKSGKWKAFAEVDRAEFFGMDVARKKINSGQVPFLDRLSDLLGG